MEVLVKCPETDVEFEKYYALRWDVLRKLWGHPKGSEKDDLEEDSFHIIVVDGDNVVGVGRLHLNSDTEAQIRYMAVAEKYRNKSIGSKIIVALESHARGQNCSNIVLNARKEAVKFYERAGYSVERKSHTLFGIIEHYRMSKLITAENRP